MKNLLLIILYLFTMQLASSQEDVITEDLLKSKKYKDYNINNRKGQFFATWGWNRSSYSTSDISFKGNNFDFELTNVKADDKPKHFGFQFFDPGGLTIPQNNAEIGYFFKNNYNFVIGYDHMKYVLREDQLSVINGTINSGNYDFIGFDDVGNEFLLENVNFDGNYTNENIILVEEFLKFEHTDGLNYIFVGINRFDNLNKLLHINTDKFEVNLEEGIDVGVLMPKTNTTILGNKRYDQFHVSGFGMSVSGGLSLTFFKRFFIKTDFKYGYINMNDIRITNDSTEKASQHFTFTETSYTFGYRFRLF